jgi:glycosyltransferase involved in cell wall biosynthesis
MDRRGRQSGEIHQKEDDEARMISILILTLNEEANLPGCLESVKWSDDIVVLDSYSTDRTVNIATASGAHIVQRRFDNWAAHQNWAVENIPFKHPWVFYLDADERMTEVLKQEILCIAGSQDEERVAFYCGRRNYFMGRWIKHAYPPSLIMRFFRPQKVRFERLVNPVPGIDGLHGYLKEMFEHYNFSKGLSEWFDKHNKYSQLEAVEGINGLRELDAPYGRLLSRDSASRRKALKSLSFRMPCRPFLKFFYFYFMQRGFLDGRPGLTYCVMQSIYEYMIVVKMKELVLREKGIRL